MAITERSFTFEPVNPNALPQLPYFFAAYKAITAHPVLFKFDIAILYVAQLYNVPLSAGWLSGKVSEIMPSSRYTEYSLCFVRLVKHGYLEKKRTSKFVHYTITVQGRKELASFAQNMEQRAKMFYDTF